MRSSYYIFIILISFCSCKEQAIQNDPNLLAEAYGDKLYLNDLELLFNNAQNKADSQFIISRYIDNWVMDKILFEEAKKEVKRNKRINDQIEDYKKSLYIHEYENIWLDQALNTSINQSEIDTFYAHNQEEYILKEDISQILYISVPLELDNDSLKNIWKTEDIPALESLKQSDERITGLFDVSKWYGHSYMKNIIPEKLFNKINFKKKESYSLNDERSKYYVKILDNLKSKNPAPVSFVQADIENTILKDRAASILKQKKQSVYQNNILDKKITIYHDK